MWFNQSVQCCWLSQNPLCWSESVQKFKSYNIKTELVGLTLTYNLLSHEPKKTPQINDNNWFVKNLTELRLIFNTGTATYSVSDWVTKSQLKH